MYIDVYRCVVYTDVLCIHTDVGDVDKIALVKVLTILQREDPREGIWYLAATGEVASLQTCIEKFPEDVCIYIQ